MSTITRYIAVGFDQSTGDADFEVSGIVANLSLESLKELRAMIPVAIASMENMWRQEQERKNPSAQESPYDDPLFIALGNKRS